jgi:hypothetical protein
MVRTEFDDVPVGLFHTVADAQRAAVMATQYTAECASIALNVMGVNVDYDGDPDRVVIVEFKDGVPDKRTAIDSVETSGSLAAFTTTVWNEAEEDEDWN